MSSYKEGAKKAWVTRRANGNDKPWNKGRRDLPKHTEEHKRKIKESCSKYKPTKETIAKISASKIGHPVSEETKRKISLAKVGKPSPLKGLTGIRKLSEKTKKAMSESRTREKHWNWQGGVTQDRKSTNYYVHLRRSRLINTGQNFTSLEWKELKESLNNFCLGCARQEPEIKLTVDHILPLSKGGHNGISNIQPLCQSCNSKKRTKTINYIEFAQI